MKSLHKPIWIKAGIYEAIKSSTYRIHKNESLILSLAQKWCLETNTFVFPWGEATITLEDVNVLMGFSISGSSVFVPLERLEMRETVEKLERQRQESLKQVSWISSFVDDEIEHEAFLVLWLSNFVFPVSQNSSISKCVFPIAVRLARGEKIALAPAVLANLYRELGLIRVLASTENVYLTSLFKLVQVWIWERFKSVRPEAIVILRDKPRIAQWDGLNQRIDGLIVLDGFEWRPYTKPLKYWNPSRFYAEEAKWITIGDADDDEFVSFARCLRVSKLVGIGVVEDYYPNRVAMQFGLSQDVPYLVTSHQNRNFTEKEAWNDYNQSLNGLKLYIPSRLSTGLVTARYREWWMKLVSEMQKKTLNPSNRVDCYDDDASLKVLPLSQVLDGTKKATNKGHKRARDSRQTQIEEEEEEEDDDDITISQVMKSRKKCSDDHVEGESIRLEEDNNNVSVLSQNLAPGDETVAATTKSVVLSSQDRQVLGKKAEDLTNKGHKRARDCPKTQTKQDDDNSTIGQVMKPREKCTDDLENDTQGESSRLVADNNNVLVLPQNLASRDETEHLTHKGHKRARVEEDDIISIGQVVTSREKCSDDLEKTQGESSILEADNNNVSTLPQNLTSRDENVAATTKSVVLSSLDDNKNSSGLLHVASNGVVAKKKEDERLKQRKVAIKELALKLEARMLKVKTTLAKIKQWKLKRNNTKTRILV
ncbi:hypothetical protein AALP_AA1G229600 [Arabis alpina]|uniref:Aminotransferase-like plant mobile domain-containing protein n=1 Tax=Arabis alpina TaxID=50452 RepID=A0A087HQ13_ARAAL|nr:hypothetical protein AALP_AA1G229600 [Arabis alpina]